MNYVISGINGALAIAPILLPAVICYWYGYEKGKADGFKRK
jgi:hypothetical protein